MTDHQEKNATIQGHMISHPSKQNPAIITVEPLGAQGMSQEGESTERIQEGHYQLINQEPGRFPSPYPDEPTAYNGRAPLPYEPQGYVNVTKRKANEWRLPSQEMNEEFEEDSIAEEYEDQIIMSEQAQPPPRGEFVSDDAFDKIVDGFTSGDGKFLAMTAYGAVPLPDQMLRSIPDKFISKPMFQEREVFVLKQDERVRTTEKDYTQFDHRFVNRPQKLNVEKITAIDDVKVIEVPHFQYKPVEEEKIIEIPYGIKYVEVPVEIRCKMPPKIVGIAKPHIVERVIETTKPVVQEKIVEVPEIVIKQVPRVVNREIPYIVPKYVEKIVEVPYKPGQELPTPQGSPMSWIPKPPPLPTMDEDSPRAPLAPSPLPSARGAPSPPISGRVEGDALIVDDNDAPQGPQTFYLSKDIKEIKLPYEAKIDMSIIEEDSIPAGVPIAQRGVRYMAPGSKALAYGEATDRKPPIGAPVYAGPMDPIVEHTAPGMRAIEFRTRSAEPDILTQQGVLKYSKFDCCLKSDVDKLLPRLPQHDLVPMDPPGTPNIHDLTYIHSQYANREATNIKVTEESAKCCRR